MAKKVAESLRALYEERPYPRVTRAGLRQPRWLLPPVEWIQAVAQPAPYPPRRILVAGCGTGLEAFAFCRRFPKAEIVGIDFAARSIAAAKRLQKHAAGWRRIRFLCADLTSADLAERTGGSFDFISCHGVLSYLPAPERALRHLARCLTPEGVLYLGVNGAGHFSGKWREFLPAFGFDMRRWPGGRRLWQHLKFVSALAGEETDTILQHGAGYLSSDLFGPLIHNLSLSEWVRICRRPGLHLRGSATAQRRLSPAINNATVNLFVPRSRAEVAELLDLLCPEAFHRLIFTRQPPPAPPWEKVGALMRWRPVRTAQFQKFKWPARRDGRLFRLENKSANIALELRGAGWEIDLFRGSDGERSLRDLLAPLQRIPARSLNSQLYLFYLLDLLNFLPPRLAKD